MTTGINSLLLELEEMTLNESNFRKIQQKYKIICDKLENIDIEEKMFDEYHRFCLVRKYFINQHDIYSPISRLSIVTHSLNYISEMLTLVMDRYFYEYKIINNIYSRYGYNVENLSKKSLNITPENELLYIKNLLNKFTVIYDRLNEKDDLPNVKLLNIAYKVIEKLMQYYVSEDLTFKLLKTWEHFQGIIFPFDEDYRDHLIHQFYVFLLGASMLPKLQKRILDNWEIYEDKKRPDDEKKEGLSGLG